MPSSCWDRARYTTALTGDIYCYTLLLGYWVNFEMIPATEQYEATAFNPATGLYDITVYTMSAITRKNTTPYIVPVSALGCTY